MRHTRCPECEKRGKDRTGDNLAVYDDHVHCYSCGYHRYTKPRVAIAAPPTTQQNGTLDLPTDLSDYIPNDPLAWLLQYGLSSAEIAKNYQWSDLTKRLYHVILDGEGCPIAYNARNFDPLSSVRYHSKGPLSSVYDLFEGTNQTTLVYVEDVVSAIKVGRHYVACPLFGSHIPLDRIRWAYKRFKRVVLWLDPDKREYALKTRLNASLRYPTISCVLSERDPKMYGDEEIRSMVQ